MAKDTCAGVGDIRGSGSPGQEDPLEEGPAAHSRVLAGASHGQSSLVGGLQLIGSPRAGHN